MNERIKELAEQATIHSKEGFYTYTQIDAEKFAKLIVRECARVDSEENNPDHIDGETYNQTILQHFGVEE